MELHSHMNSLVQCCLEQVLLNPGLLSHMLSLGFPARIHHAVFSEAAHLALKHHENIGHGVRELIAHWPSDTFRITDLLPEHQAVNILQAGGAKQQCLLDMILDGLLHLDPQSPLKCVDFSGIYVPMLFQLPLLALPMEERCSDAILELIQKTCKEFFHESQEDDNLESVLSWKLMDIKERAVHKKISEAVRVIEVKTECQVNMSDWVAMDDIMLGLIVQSRTPFKMNINRISINNYHQRQIPHLRWLMTMIGPEVLTELIFYGTRKSISLLMWEIGDFLKKFPNIQVLGMGTQGPKLRTFTEPTVEEITLATCQVFSNWNSLSELHFLGLVLTQQIATILTAIPNPLKRLKLAACSLHRNDLDMIASSHHLENLENLSLEKNNLRGMCRELCDILQKSTKLSKLSLKETALSLNDKLEVMCTLQGSRTIEMLVLYENEDMVTAEGYQTMVEMGCMIPSLKHFYLFPFNYKPFDVFLRRSVEAACVNLLVKYRRDDLGLFY